MVIEEVIDDLGWPNKRWTEVFSFPADIMARLKNGRVNVDQIGWSIFSQGSDGIWRRLDRAQYRRRQWNAAWLAISRP
jgi:hypothetical protein